jgi:hypothetical protein
MTKLAQQRWAETQKRLNSLEKQVKLLFKRMDPIDVPPSPEISILPSKQEVKNPWEILPAVIQNDMNELIKRILIVHEVSVEDTEKAFDRRKRTSCCSRERNATKARRTSKDQS